MNTLLVTGGAGFIGNAFVRLAVARGHKVVVLDALTYAGHKENLRGVEHVLEIGNICDGTLVLKLLEKYKVDAVVNFAAESHVDNSIAKPSAFIETNINGVYALLEASRSYWGGMDAEKKKSFRFLQVSTDEVYGSLGAEGKFSEETSMRPNSPYSASKAAGDHLARAWHETYGLPTIVTNCTNNYGPRQHPEKLIPLMITRALSGGQLPVYGKGQNIRDWIHVEDHCHGVHLALTKGVLGETYCFGGDAEKRNIDVVNTICGILDELQPKKDGSSYSKQIAFVTDRWGHDFRYAIDDSKAQRTIGFTRNYNFERGLRDTILWYLNNAEWSDVIMRKSA